MDLSQNEFELLEKQFGSDFDRCEELARDDFEDLACVFTKKSAEQLVGNLTGGAIEWEIVEFRPEKHIYPRQDVEVILFDIMHSKQEGKST